MSGDDFPPFGKAQGALSSVEARTAEAGRGRPVPARRVHDSGQPLELATIRDGSVRKRTVVTSVRQAQPKTPRRATYALTAALPRRAARSLQTRTASNRRVDGIDGRSTARDNCGRLTLAIP